MTNFATVLPSDAAVLEDPYPYYRWLRDESPCHWVEPWKTFVVSRHEDVVMVLRNHAVFSSTGGVGLDWVQRPMMPMYDPPQHTRLRRLVQPFFTPKAITAWSEKVAARAEELLGNLIDAGEGDFYRSVAVPLALGNIAILLGVPHDRMEDLRRWGEGIIEGLAGGLSEDAQRDVETLRVEFVTFLKELVKSRRENPHEHADVVSMLLRANDDDALTNKEVIAFCVLLLTAGFETTSHATSNGALALMANPDQWKEVVEDPSLVPSMVEEVVRYDCSIQSFFRDTLSDTEIAGTKVPKGHKVMVLFGSANRDSRKYEDPDRFLVKRNPEHVGYGVGIHYCLGAPLARMTMAALSRVAVRRVAKMELTGDIVRTRNILFRGVQTMPVRVRAR